MSHDVYTCIFLTDNDFFYFYISKPCHMKKILLLFILAAPLLLNAQEENKFGIKFSGYVKNDFFFDSRQVESLREGHFLLYPLNVSYDKDSADANAQCSFGILSIQSRLTGNITGPDALGAKTSGVIEAEFFGTSNADINGFRLRHAYVKLNWKNTELLFGQTWHPMFISSCFPEVVSFNTGAPFQPFARAPQIRLTQSFGKFNLMVAAIEQRDFTSNGPDGASSKYLRNSAIPDMDLQLFYKKTDEADQTEFIAGAGADYKIIKPRLMTAESYKTKETIGGLSAMVYVKLKTKPITWKIEGVYGQNLYDLTMLSGYACKYETDSARIAKKDFSYTTLDVFSAWTEIMTNGKKWQFGLFGGYTKNLGSIKNINDWTNATSYFSRGRDINNIFRVSPRVVFNAGKLRLALEGEYTSAAYCRNATKDINSLGEVSNLKSISNIRVLLGVYYFF
jgi:hypothetical protein